MERPETWSPEEAREKIRTQYWTGPTSGLAPGYIQGNLVVLPEAMAFEFLLFCQRNPKPCPVLDVTEPGSPVPRLVAPDSDLRMDLPGYRVYRNGQLTEELTDITEQWDENMVGFLLGCSFTFEQALIENGIPLRHMEEKKNVSMYKTNIQCVPAGRFSGPMVVSMRPVKAADISKAVQVTSRFPSVHGAPIHVGDPGAIGIADLSRPDFGDPVTIKDGEIPVFWACGVTPQAVAMHMKPELMLTHAPGHMFITDKKNEDYSIG
ncbi:putative hydro-lyase [Thalassobacillus devorans]|uniref:putative hydro-lyase n=1 Tax=Thalassobacillus devorans TaxID=279813 RepID=UPI0004921C06|nr:putative hydro-lyase [Thalassobacillus devorans]